MQWALQKYSAGQTLVTQQMLMQKVSASLPAQAVGLLCLLFAPCQELRHAAAGRCQYSQWHPRLCALAELRETWTSRVRSALGGTIEVQHMPPQYTMFSRILLVLACYKGLQPFRQR